MACGGYRGRRWTGWSGCRSRRVLWETLEERGDDPGVGLIPLQLDLSEQPGVIAAARSPTPHRVGLVWCQQMVLGARRLLPLGRVAEGKERYIIGLVGTTRPMMYRAVNPASLCPEVSDQRLRKWAIRHPRPPL